jgi:hypothetical protein
VLSPPNSLAQQPHRHAPLSATRGRVRCRRRLGRLPPQSYVGSASPSCSSSSPSPCFPSWATVVVVAAPQQPCPLPHERRANAHLKHPFSPSKSPKDIQEAPSHGAAFPVRFTSSRPARRVCTALVRAGGGRKEVVSKAGKERDCAAGSPGEEERTVPPRE